MILNSKVIIFVLAIFLMHMLPFEIWTDLSKEVQKEIYMHNSLVLVKAMI